MKKAILSSMLLLGMGLSVYAQGSAAATQTLREKTEAFAAEVYQDFPVYTSPTHLSIYEENLSRVEVKSLARTAGEQLTLLSTIDLKSKYNSSIQRDNAQTFNPATFNALKYLINFYPKQDEVYRVDNTDYIIVVHPKP